MLAQAMLLGGNLRVGLEDNLYLRAACSHPTPSWSTAPSASSSVSAAHSCGSEEVRHRLGLAAGQATGALMFFLYRRLAEDRTGLRLQGTTPALPEDEGAVAPAPSAG